MGSLGAMTDKVSHLNWEGVYSAIMESDKILLSTHENPDGDGLGCELSMAYFLKKLGKDFKIINSSPLPQEYKFLAHEIQFEEYDKKEHSQWIETVDLAIIFDVGDFIRCRSISDEIVKHQIGVINIDHHPHPEDHPFMINLVDIDAAATGCMIYDFLSMYEEDSLPKNILEGIYVAVMTDTGCFRHSNTDEKCHSIAQEAIRLGVNTSKIYQYVYENSTKTRIALLGKVLSQIKYELDGTFAWFTISKGMLNEVNGTRADVDGFTDFVRTIGGVQVAMMIYEHSDTLCRVNLRGKGAYSVNGVAKALGGGGHRLAAGAVVSGSLSEVSKLATQLALDSIKAEQE